MYHELGNMTDSAILLLLISCYRSVSSSNSSIHSNVASFFARMLMFDCLFSSIIYQISPSNVTRSLSDCSNTSTPCHKSSSLITKGGAILTLFAVAYAKTPRCFISAASLAAVTRPEGGDSSILKEQKSPRPVTVTGVSGHFIEERRSLRRWPRSKER